MDYVDRETPVARQSVEDAETAIKQEQEDMWNAQKAGLTTRKPKNTFDEMLSAMRDSLSDVACSDDEEYGDDEEEDGADEALGKLREVDEPGWEMGTISKTVEQPVDSFRQTQMKHVELMQLCLGDAADNFHDGYKKYVMAKPMVPAVVKPQTVQDATRSALATLGELRENLDIVSGQSQIPHETLQPGCSHLRRCSRKPQSKNALHLARPTQHQFPHPLSMRSLLNP